MDATPPPEARTRKKPSYPVGEDLRNYLKRYRRERELPVTYERLRHFHESHPLMDTEGRNTLWESVAYPAEEIPGLNEDLKRIYALLRVDGDFSVMQHLYIDRIDFCSFGNSTPFRIKIVNAYNDNPDYFYIKKADASRVYGLELEHLLSPNRLNFLTAGTTLVEEHIAGIPGDIFIERWLHRPELRPIRIAKELVKFNERSFVQLLGDMRSYNFVVVITPDFEGSQIRIRAMDFDQQAHNGRKTFYLPQFFKENLPLVEFCKKHLHLKTAFQYQREEQTLMLARAELAASRLDVLLTAMARDTIAPPENVVLLREGLAAHFKNDRYLQCESMGALVRANLDTLRHNIHQGLGALKADQILGAS
ncbi:hypothetical protein [Opitutus sp. GAS368]|jgi:hypothetical protein|uniref:hypothetical protein n=1 Tax=Opitutus sp. GAS368 TaxID=1882749 RepID=UPI00087C0AFB|nr:hypothetical protein [Opitutus sp. GAS368]SDR94321.1 hypothetical protein SAMN05444173_1408 [Opitutus sp. GAS368]